MENKTFYNLNLSGVTDEDVDYLEDFSFDEQLQVTVILTNSADNEVVLRPDDNQFIIELHDES